MAQGRVFACNFDDRPGALCRDGCHHPAILYVPMAAGFRCDGCRTFLSNDLKPETMRQFHDRHARCLEPPAPVDPAPGVKVES
jgi:hypothetical protein